MKTKFALTALAAAAAVFSQGAFAQASSPTRADVKAEAKTGALAPAGQGPSVDPKKAQPSTMSDKTRMDRKETTKMDRASGSLKPAGEAAGAKEEKAEASKASMTSRADRKATTKAAVKSGGTQPAGEAPQPSAEPAKK